MTNHEYRLDDKIEYRGKTYTILDAHLHEDGWYLNLRQEGRSQMVLGSVNKRENLVIGGPAHTLDNLANGKTTGPVLRIARGNLDKGGQIQKSGSKTLDHSKD